MKWLMITALLVGLAGGALLSYGAWLLLPAAGFMVAGCLCLGWSYLVSRMLSHKLDKEA
ncbi:phage protein [Xenorhabdus bovienii]|uniref:phage protein n=1 Tax=Xenorhabdus bovienii TaxID=40576 RepID=UPI0004DAC4EF|nr:phage protein [Xenorhabdus bovienii]CDG88042.1 e14 prophage [Xenorhabdus bovienii str. feltiae France]CDG90639.1 e14 prophage [Xenorhabdus bovienii str. feltiae Florida]